MDIAPNDLVILAVDRGANAPVRAYYAATGTELTAGKAPVPLGGNVECSGRVLVVLTPTRTFAEGLGCGTSERAPEDRALIRLLARRFPGRVDCALLDQSVVAGPTGSGPRRFFEFNPDMLRAAPRLMRECWTVPNRQDYLYLVTKTFGLNLLVRIVFMIMPVRNGGLNLLRAAAALTWYQLQDTVFTVFGQTYMKFLGRMTAVVRIGPARLGDFFFVYFQLCFFEFLNRLVLGPLGMNPLVYTWEGMALIFVNILQGMVSGGPLIPAINKMRRAGVIGHSTLMHLYQLSSLTMQFGLFASFGYQRFYFLLTTLTLVLSWGSYAMFSLFYQDSSAEPLPGRLASRLNAAAARIS